ncbi:MAG: flagellar biosynthesis protein FliQ [Proteobacteria bacterium]|nr:flagellar biosynthesis protein FliQ [Pseudomonadota bacterium]
MTEALLNEIARDAFMTFLKAGMPLMLVGLVVGFAISLVQALTQIQEQTLVYVPKVVSVLLSLIFLLPFMGDALGGYMRRLAEKIITGG